MSVTTAFNSRVRDAGDLERDSRLYGSFRSINRFELDERRTSIGEKNKSRHDDIFVSMIQPAVETAPLPPAAPTSAKNREGKKRTKKHESNRPPRPKIESTSNELDNGRNNEEEEFMVSLRRRASQNRRRRLNNENQEPSNLNASLDEKKSDVVGPRLRSNSLIVKRAFEEPEKGLNESIVGDGNDAEVAVEARKPSTTPNPTPRRSSESKQNNVQINEYFSPILKSCSQNFVLSPAPQLTNTIVNCKIVCQKGLFNEYLFYLDGIVNDGRDLLVMKAQRRVTSTKAYYLIYLVNYDQKGNQFTDMTASARIISNIYRNKFRLELSNGLAVSAVNTELLTVRFKSAIGEPVRIKANACLCSIPGGKETPIRDRVTYFLKNRQPRYDPEVRKYVLDYNGRAKKSSKHNFQIVDESRATDEVLIQIGKLDNGVYSCDFTFPLCALQAFGFALSSLCR